jgi:hypothetical protein
VSAKPKPRRPASLDVQRFIDDKVREPRRGCHGHP